MVKHETKAPPASKEWGELMAKYPEAWAEAESGIKTYIEETINGFGEHVTEYEAAQKAEAAK